MRGFAYLTIASMLFFAGWTQAQNAEQASRVLVDGDVRITAEMYRYEILRFPKQAQEQLRSNPALARREVIDEMYRRIKLVKEAERRNLGEDPGVQYEIERGRQIALSQALVNQLREEVQVPDLNQAAREHYLGAIDKYRLSEAIRVRHILLRSEEEEPADRRRDEAEDLLKQLQQGADFAELARVHSQDGAAERGGDIGWIERGNTVPPFEQAAFALQSPNELSGIVESSFGLHIIQLLERREASVRQFEEVKETIMAELREKFISDAVDDKMRPIMDHSGATANQEIIEEVVREGI